MNTVTTSLVKKTNLLSLILCLIPVITYTKTIYISDITKDMKVPAATLTLIGTYCLWSFLAERGSDSFVKYLDAQCDRERFSELKNKLFDGTISSGEWTEFLQELKNIINADWIGFYKKVKERIGISFKTADGRSIDIEGVEKTRGSRGLGKIFQHIEGLKETTEYFVKIAAILGFIYILKDGQINNTYIRIAHE